MWLRDSANQMQSYLSLLTASSLPNSLASLYRGVINLQARYLLTSPFCNSFQPPAESGIRPSNNGASNGDSVKPSYDSRLVFECKYELDSLAAFLEVSSNYYNATKDIDFFRKYKWVDAINAVLAVANNMTIGTYADSGQVNESPYTFTRLTTRATETLANNGIGNPVHGRTGLIRSAFRPSDDSTIYQLYIPSNMMFSRYLDSASLIMRDLGNQQQLADQMHNLASSIRDAIMMHGVINDPVYGSIFAFEIDGFGSRNVMDDANIPSLLSAPFLGFIDKADNVYQATRKVLLSENNPYFMRGPVINA
jgi:meiotically up-regulated gene 157 (Mug157) protein